MSKQFYIDPTEPDQGEFKLVPEGERVLSVVGVKERQSKNEDYMVEVALQDALTKTTMRHWVTFVPEGMPGHGIGKHWLKTLGEPFEGEILIEPENWRSKSIRAVVIHEEKNGKTFAALDIGTISPAETSNEEAPF